MKPVNAGNLNRRITVMRYTETTGDNGFVTKEYAELFKAWANIRDTRGYTLVANSTNFEDATTRVLIRKPNQTIGRKDRLQFKGKNWEIVYINDVDDGDKFIEMQVREVTQ